MGNIKLIKILLFSLLLFLSIIVAIAIITTSPTIGKKIETYQNPKTAVMIIDMQEDSIGINATNPFPIPGSEALIENNNKLISKAKNNNWIIVYIKEELPREQSFLTHGKLVKNTSGAEIDSRIKIESQNIFTKAYNDAFWNPALSKLLIENQVNEIYISGIAADACVKSTALGAINRGYKVNAVKEGIGMMDPTKLDKTLGEYLRRGINVISINQIN
jgi:nicotinamidase-related amidase